MKTLAGRAVLRYNTSFPIKGTKVVEKHRRMNPRYYRGTRKTSHGIEELLPKALARIGRSLKGRSDLVMTVWPDVIGPKFVEMAKAVKFTDGVLEVRVANSTLLSILVQSDKYRILRNLRARLPEVSIRDVWFRIG